MRFCERRQLSEKGTEHLIQAVTTQMSSLGLALGKRDETGRGRGKTRGRGTVYRYVELKRRASYIERNSKVQQVVSFFRGLDK